MKRITVLLAALLLPATPSAQSPKPLDIYFIDVEGGQATLFVTPSGESMLIDTGHPGNGDRDVNRVLATIKQAGLTKLDYLLVTHYHNDHVGNAAAIAARIPVGMFVDHGEHGRDRVSARAFYQGYLKGRATGRHMLAKPGDTVPIRDLDVTIVTAGGKGLKSPAQARQIRCARASRPRTRIRARTRSRLDRSSSSAVPHAGPRRPDVEQGTRAGVPDQFARPIDVYLTTHHGLTQSGPQVIVHTLRPRVAIMNNGPKKRGAADAMQIVRSSPGLEDFWHPIRGRCRQGGQQA